MARWPSYLRVRRCDGGADEWLEKSFDRMIEVNLKGVWLCMKHEIPLMLANGGGGSVNTASIAGLIGLRAATGYVGPLCLRGRWWPCRLLIHHI
jgi:NAD(P)-dependent dehydrogenase (short-subunit alcohol dehydrogenase family)